MLVRYWVVVLLVPFVVKVVCVSAISGSRLGSTPLSAVKEGGGRRMNREPAADERFVLYPALDLTKSTGLTFVNNAPNLCTYILHKF